MKNLNKKLKLARIMSNSMFPVLKRGDTVLLNEDRNLKRGDLIAFYSQRKVPTVHRLVGSDKKNFFTIADHNTKFDMDINKSSYIGRVEMVKISQEWISCHSLILKIYFYVMQYVSRKIVKDSQSRFLLVFRKLIAYQIRFIFWFSSKVKKIVNDS